MGVLVGVSLMATIATGALLLHWLAQQDLTTIAVGATAAASLVTLKSRLFGDLLETARDIHDLVALTSPQPPPVVDPVALARRTSAILLIADAGSAKVEALRAARDVPRRVDRRPLGDVLNGVRGFERRASVGAPLQLAPRRGGG
jgi:hypothetical protein